MSIFEKRLVIPLHWAILLLLVVLTGVFWSLFKSFAPLDKGWTTPEGLFYVLASGMVPGLVVALIQYILQWSEFREISRLRGLKVKSILMTRDDARYYGSLIEKAKKQIDLMGGTASRFLEDFAAFSSPIEANRVLLSALDRKVHVRIIVANETHLGQVGQQEKFASAARQLAELKSKYPDNFEYKYFDHPPTHNIFRIDNDCLVGPQFPNIRSKDTPAVHTVCDGTFAKPYIDYFNYEWGLAVE